MALSTKTIARAASAARRALGRKDRPPVDAEPAASAATKQTAATKKTAAKKTAAKKAPTKKTAAKRTAAKTAPTKKTVATKAADTKAPKVKKPAAKKSTTKKTTPQTTAPTKKASVKKTPAAPAATPQDPSTLVVQEGEEAWTSAELAELVSELHQQREHSLEIIDGQSEELTGLLRDSGDGAGHDQADVGATSFERDHELTVLSSERDKIAQIERALGRIEDGSYGQCESCAQPIGKMRLMAFPRATMCLTCKQREERR